MSAPPQNPVQDNGLDVPHVQAEPCAAWYAAHGRAVYNYFRFQLVPPDDAEDFTAETFLRAVRAADRYDASRAGVQTWLLDDRAECPHRRAPEREGATAGGDRRVARPRDG